MRKPILCLDFDGVCHSYTSGWKGVTVILDPPVNGLFQFIQEAVKHFTVAIYSTRSDTSEGREAMRIWLGRWSVDPEHGLPHDVDLSFLGEIEWPEEKPPALVTLDDRAITFDGTWPTMETLQNFKPWNKKGE
jgi:hypothetical protein